VKTSTSECSISRQRKSSTITRFPRLSWPRCWSTTIPKLPSSLPRLVNSLLWTSQA
jgi:hypothetical protein